MALGWYIAHSTEFNIINHAITKSDTSVAITSIL